MPLYHYKCDSCDQPFERFVKLSEYKSLQTCTCGGAGSRVLMAPAVRGDYPGYECPVTGNWIEGRRAHEENLRRHGCRVLEPGETQAATRSYASADATLETEIDRTAEEFIASLPAEKHEKLAAEMEAGVTATVERL